MVYIVQYCVLCSDKFALCRVCCLMRIFVKCVLECDFWSAESVLCNVNAHCTFSSVSYKVFIMWCALCSVHRPVHAV